MLSCYISAPLYLATGSALATGFWSYPSFASTMTLFSRDVRSSSFNSHSCDSIVLHSRGIFPISAALQTRIFDYQIHNKKDKARRCNIYRLFWLLLPGSNRRPVSFVSGKALVQISEKFINNAYLLHLSTIFLHPVTDNNLINQPIENILIKFINIRKSINLVKCKSKSNTQAKNVAITSAQTGKNR